MKFWNEIRKAATALASVLILLCAFAAHGAHLAWGGDANALFGIVIDAKPSGISSSAYLAHWRVEMIKLLDGECDTVALVLEVDKKGAVSKWIGMTREDSGHLVMSKPQDRILEECVLNWDGFALSATLKPNEETSVRDVTNWATVTAEDAERWIYWAGTVLAGIKTVDDDPDILPCLCGIKDL